ncbi:MAG: class I SAM-dependent methyltransferase [Alphaproteobacteria bacterium]|nr:class I SAM-dependent methyltransferase [Alphaproteobacteria bacterium]
MTGTGIPPAGDGRARRIAAGAEHDDIYARTRAFWDAKPCSSGHVAPAPGTRAFFAEIDRLCADLYPYLPGFIDAPGMGGKRVLEIGIGAGYALQLIARHAAHALGIDLSGETLRLNARRAALQGLDIGLIQASVTALPLADASVDEVVSIGCIHHVPDVRLAIDEIHRVLRPGGTFKGMVYNRNSWRYRVTIPLARRLSARWRGKTARDCVNEMYDGPGNPYGEVYSKAQMRDLLRRFDRPAFAVRNFSGSDAIPRFGHRVPRNLWLATFGRLAGLDLYFTAAKP